MYEDLTAEQQAHQERLLQGLLAETKTKIALRKEIDELKQRADGIYAVGARVETREETSGDWGRWSEPSSVGEVVLIRRAPERAPIQPATYDVRYGDGRVAEAVPLERVRRYPGTPCYAPNGKAYCSPLESPHNLIIQASNVGDAATAGEVARGDDAEPDGAADEQPGDVQEEHVVEPLRWLRVQPPIVCHGYLCGDVLLR